MANLKNSQSLITGLFQLSLNRFLWKWYLVGFLATQVLKQVLNWIGQGHQRSAQGICDTEQVQCCIKIFIQNTVQMIIIQKIIIWPVRPHARCHCNPQKSAACISASKAEKRRTALLATRTVPCDAILEDFVAFKHPSYLQPEKQMKTTYQSNFLCKFYYFFSPNFIF